MRLTGDRRRRPRAVPRPRPADRRSGERAHGAALQGCCQQAEALPHMPDVSLKPVPRACEARGAAGIPRLCSLSMRCRPPTCRRLYDSAIGFSPADAGDALRALVVAPALRTTIRRTAWARRASVEVHVLVSGGMIGTAVVLAKCLLPALPIIPLPTRTAPPSGSHRCGRHRRDGSAGGACGRRSLAPAQPVARRSVRSARVAQHHPSWRGSV
jgi:hypothetical protein